MAAKHSSYMKIVSPLDHVMLFPCKHTQEQARTQSNEIEIKRLKAFVSSVCGCVQTVVIDSLVRRFPPILNTS